MKYIWPRTRLARDIAIILTVKLVALVAIKLIWFSDTPTAPAAQVQETLFGPSGR